MLGVLLLVVQAVRVVGAADELDASDLGDAPKAVGGARFELMPMVGYRLNGSLDLAGPRFNRVDFLNNTLLGFSVGYLTPEDGEIELSWTHSRANAEIQKPGGVPDDRFGVHIDQLHVNCIYMTEPAGEPLQPFVLLGLGGTHFNPDVGTAVTRFSFAIGGGYKWLLNEHLGWRLDARWTPTLAFNGTHFFRDPNEPGGTYSVEHNSYLGSSYPLLNNFEFTLGLMFRI